MLALGPPARPERDERTESCYPGSNPSRGAPRGAATTVRQWPKQSS